MTTLLTASQLGPRIKYTSRHINEYLKDRVFLPSVHYIRLPGSRRILYNWEAIERDFFDAQTGIPMAGGGVCNG